eukprot:scaffold275682_cov22-Prasinocladus_malaysianus.AAC.1
MIDYDRLHDCRSNICDCSSFFLGASISAKDCPAKQVVIANYDRPGRLTISRFASLYRILRLYRFRGHAGRAGSLPVHQHQRAHAVFAPGAQLRRARPSFRGGGDGVGPGGGDWGPGAGRGRGPPEQRQGSQGLRARQDEPGGLPTHPHTGKQPNLARHITFILHWTT